MARSFHSTLISRKLQQAVRRSTNQEGGGVFSRWTSVQIPDDQLQISSSKKTLHTCNPHGRSHMRGILGVRGGVRDSHPLFIVGRRHMGGT